MMACDSSVNFIHLLCFLELMIFPPLPFCLGSWLEHDVHDGCSLWC
jgi:hypothetical protein